MKELLKDKVVGVVGLGYVGLPLAQALARHLHVIGYDNNSSRVALAARDNAESRLELTDQPQSLHRADFAIICVATPVTASKIPDLSYVEAAARTIGHNLKEGCTVVLESTVYPGVTEELVGPVVERESGKKRGQGFHLAYCPERMNPGDEEHTLEHVVKVVSAEDEDTLDLVAALYSLVCRSVFRARDMKTAEAAKVVENIQRDLNIALANELALICERMGLNTRDVLDTAATKWNFQRYQPGLVGGHCIPVDPYYLVHRAEELGYHPQVILAGRAINDYMPRHVAHLAIQGLDATGRGAPGARILIMGLTYKENVPDTRVTPARDIIRELRAHGLQVLGYDPLVADIEGEFGIAGVNGLDGLRVDGIILTLAHRAFAGITLERLKSCMGDHPILIDVRGFYNGEQARGLGIYYRQL